MTTNEDELLKGLVPVVTRIARGMSRVYVHEEYADLYQDGCIGALRAVRGFDRTRGNALETFARPIIAGAIINAVRERDPLSRRARKLIRDAETVRGQMEREGRTAPTLDELAVKIRGLGGALLAARRAEPYLHSERVDPLDVAAVEDEQPAEIVARREQAVRLRHAVSNLTPRLRAVIADHYFGNQSAVQISKRMQITSVRVGQLRDTALARMRTELGSGV